ncbi:MAG: SUMF1/EgtB/PvdO family nonheme iron enzyme [Bacteroidota bacterium]
MKEYPYVPSGSYYPDLSFLGKERPNPDQKISVQGFYIAQHEVTNAQYRSFLSALEQAGRTEDLEIAKIHNENWIMNSKYLEPFVKVYHEHPAYDAYPVVNVS